MFSSLFRTAIYQIFVSNSCISYMCVNRIWPTRFDILEKPTKRSQIDKTHRSLRSMSKQESDMGNLPNVVLIKYQKAPI